MSDWLRNAFAEGFRQLQQHANSVGPYNIDEFTFRAFVMAAMVDRAPGAQIQSEWQRYDLLAQNEGSIHLIEFKCYVTRRMRHLDGRPGHWKGGAGLQNESEFWRNISKLEACKLPAIDGRHMVLCYEQASLRRSQYSFQQSFGSISAGSRFSSIEDFQGDTLRCRWMTLR